jgi:hypothetical protein
MGLYDPPPAYSITSFPYSASMDHVSNRFWYFGLPVNSLRAGEVEFSVLKLFFTSSGPVESGIFLSFELFRN